MNWAPHFYDFLLVRATGGCEMGDEHHNGVVSHRDLEGVMIRVLNSTITKALTRLQVAIKMRAPINELFQQIESQANR